ncbi:hypothetical protein GH741_11865 [Aquibacillus halophilus]|uniref:Uncharacterized protein n=1 Tax=Aquibacillus halophilus TaxID=930132 RepID=A0A6A8DCE9_9BACI|nr:hypothetical protein [Aquibacillus halophilus]MRH43375.1 hypothetical protein [Aquibacillus halophilus]
MYVVSNCFNWIGFHFLQKILNNSEEVVGLDQISTDKEENLYLSVGRNSLFTHVTSKRDLKKEINSKQVDVVFDLMDSDELLADEEFHADNWVQFKNEIAKDNTNNLIHVELPLLYGEWMPRDNNGIFHTRNYIKFDSETFENEAIYIDDFVDAMWQILSSRKKPEKIKFKSLRKEGRDEKDPAQVLYIREKERMETRLLNLNNHFEQFSKFY